MRVASDSKVFTRSLRIMTNGVGDDETYTPFIESRSTREQSGIPIMLADLLLESGVYLVKSEQVGPRHNRGIQ